MSLAFTPPLFTNTLYQTYTGTCSLSYLLLECLDFCFILTATSKVEHILFLKKSKMMTRGYKMLVLICYVRGVQMLYHYVID